MRSRELVKALIPTDWSNTDESTGCVTCKQRRVKCDETRPTCRNCHKGRRDCSYALPAKALNFRGFRHVVLEQDPLRNAIVVSDEVRRSVEYFCLKSLPILRKSQPSALWDYLVAQLLDSGGIVRSIAAALGAQQRVVEHDGSAEAQSRGMVKQATHLYAHAITNLRRSISESTGIIGPLIPLACLLMIVLESIRGSTANLLIHLQSGLHITRALERSPSSASREVARLLRRYAVDATVFDALSPSAHAIRLIVAEQSEISVPSNPLAQVVQLVSDLLHSMLQAAGQATPASDLCSVSPNKLEYLRPQQQKVEKAINDKIAGMESREAWSMAAYGFAKAQCLMVKIYINYVWIGRQSAYDDALDLFREIVDIEEESLRLLNSFEGDAEDSGAPAAFSVGLAAQLTIMLVVKECRDANLRRRAFRLLDRCPRYDGVRNTALVKAICLAIIKTEETAAGGTGNPIPEHCRVRYYRLVGNELHPNGWQAITLYRRSHDNGSLITCDVPLEVG